MAISAASKITRVVDELFLPMVRGAGKEEANAGGPYSLIGYSAPFTLFAADAEAEEGAVAERLCELWPQLCEDRAAFVAAAGERLFDRHIHLYYHNKPGRSTRQIAP